VGEVVDDGVVTSKVKAALIAEPVTKAGQINVATNEGVVQLSGFVDSTEEKQKATDVARSVDGVRDVQNQLDIKQKP
jgi:hyperosmotically inducible protein